jgi:hypothetical protein
MKNSKNNITGRNKRNIPLPIFKNEPMGRNSEYTYESALRNPSEIQRLPIEVFVNRKAGQFMRLLSSLGAVITVCTERIPC